MGALPVAAEFGLKAPCKLCGDLLHLVADLNLDEFTWVDASGSKLGTDSDLRQLELHGGAWARLEWLAAEMGRLLKTQRTRQGEKVWPDELMRAEYFARGREYSALKVRLSNGTFHNHHISSSVIPPGWAGQVPVCCGWPGWLRPSGWQCRRCGQPLPA